ncbi:MAG: NAD(P)H-binding protein [Microscillaceae bacterium]
MIVVTGASGNTGHILAEQLLKAGQAVRVIGRQADKLATLRALGAEAAIGDMADAQFLEQAFAGATAVYALVPPKWDLQEPWRAYQRRVSQALTAAIEKNGVRYVVLLSSNGAHLPEGAGPVTGLHELEEMLKQIPGLNVMSLRAGFFMQNFFGLIGMIKDLGMFGYSLRADLKLPVVHTRDIASVAFRYLQSLDFEGFQYVFVPGERDLSMPEIAQVLGQAIGKPTLAYVPFSPEQAKAGMMQAGVPETIADGYNELFACLNSGDYLNDYQRTPENTNPTSIEDFAQEFAAAYQAS